MHGLVRASCLALAFFSSLPAQGRVLIVDSQQGPGADFFNLGEAIAAAGEGDVLMLRTGGYSPALISGKSLTLIAENGANVLVDSISITDLAADQQFTMRGIRAQPIMQRNTFEADSNAGSILIEDCEFVGATGIGFLFPVSSSANLTDCEAVTFVRCILSAPGNQFPPFGRTPMEGVHGLIATDSRVSLFGCELGGANNDSAGGQGGHGALLTGGGLFAADSQFSGGAGGPAGDSIFGKLPGGEGGDGLELNASANGIAKGLVRGSTFAGGQGGLAAGNCPAGSIGVGIDEQGGGVAQSSEEPRSFEMSSPVVAGTATTLSFAGPPGDQLFLVASTGHSTRFDSLLQASLVPGPVFTLLSIGSMPLGMTLDLDLLMPPLPFGVDSASLVAQSVVISPALEIVLGSPSTLVVLNQDL